LQDAVGAELSGVIFFMLSPSYSIGKVIMISGCLSAAFVHLSVHSSGQILLPQYLMNGLSNLDETYREYLLAPADDLIRFRRSKVAAGHRGGESVHFDAGALKSV